MKNKKPTEGNGKGVPFFKENKDQPRLIPSAHVDLFIWFGIEDQKQRHVPTKYKSMIPEV